jgi:hypothetical protein
VHISPAGQEHSPEQLSVLQIQGASLLSPQTEVDGQHAPKQPISLDAHVTHFSVVGPP